MKNKTLQTILIIFITGTLLLAMGLIAGVLLLRNSTNQPLINQASPTPVRLKQRHNRPVLQPGHLKEPSPLPLQVRRLQPLRPSRRTLQPRWI